MLILATVAVETGIGSISESKMLSFVSKMQIIQKKVDNLVENNEFNELGAALTPSQKTMVETIITAENLNTNKDNVTLKYFNKATIISQLEIENIDDDILIDFATREVISLNGIKYEGTMHYTQYNLPGGQKVVLNPPNRTVEFSTAVATINGLNATFTISGISISNGTLSYSRNNKETWTEITNYTVAGQDVVTENLTKSGTYYFKLVDNVTGDEYKIEEEITDEETNEISTIETYPSAVLRLTNSPQLKGNLELVRNTYNYSDYETISSNWAYAEANEKEYVWIPRFAYNEDNKIEFLRGSSYVTTSEDYLPSSGWEIPEPLKNVTGLWIDTSTYDLSNKPGNVLDIVYIVENGTAL